MILFNNSTVLTHAMEDIVVCARLCLAYTLSAVQRVKPPPPRG